MIRNFQVNKLDGRERQLGLKIKSGVIWRDGSNQRLVRHVVLVPGECDIEPSRVSQEPDALLHIRPHARHDDEVFLATLDVGKGLMGLAC